MTNKTKTDKLEAHSMHSIVILQMKLSNMMLVKNQKLLRLRLVPSFKLKSVLYCTYIVNYVQKYIFFLLFLFILANACKRGLVVAGFFLFAVLYLFCFCCGCSFCQSVFAACLLLSFILGDGLCDQIYDKFSLSFTVY